MQPEEYQKRLEIAINLLGEEAGQRYMDGRLRRERRRLAQLVQEEIRRRLTGLTWLAPIHLQIDLGPQGVQVKLLPRRCSRAGVPGGGRPEKLGGQP